MVDAAIKLVLHPLPCPVAGKQRHGPGDEILKIEQAALSFEIVIALQQIVDQRQRGQIEPHQTQFLQPVEPLFDTRRRRVEILLEIRQKFFFTAAEQT